MSAFLDDFDLDPVVRERLRALGAGDARALYAMYRAAPKDFAAYVGASTPNVIALLVALLPVELEAPAPQALGAELGKTPLLESPTVDIELRDRLFDDLQRLRAKPASTERDLAIAALEARLNSMLDS